MSRIAIATISPAIYSTRPWPKGWSSSASWPASRKPMRVTTEVAASDKLFTASATMATEEVSVPAITLPRNSSTLRKMPAAPEMVPQRSLVAGAWGAPPPRQARIKKFIADRCLPNRPRMTGLICIILLSHGNWPPSRKRRGRTGKFFRPLGRPERSIYKLFIPGSLFCLNSIL